MVRGKEFTDWFGDWMNDPKHASQALDENGEPLLVYHAAAIAHHQDAHSATLRGAAPSTPAPADVSSPRSRVGRSPSWRGKTTTLAQHQAKGVLLQTDPQRVAAATQKVVDALGPDHYLDLIAPDHPEIQAHQALIDSSD